MKNSKTYFLLGILSPCFIFNALFAAPEVTSIIPLYGPKSGGTLVTIYGVNFTNASNVNFGPFAAESFSVNSDSSISAITPPGVNGNFDVTIVAEGEVSSATPNDLFTFQGTWTAYVANEGSNTVTPIDLSTNTAGVGIDVGSYPLSLAITPNGLTAYVANALDNTITPIDLTTNTAGTPIQTGSWPNCIAISPDGSTAYIALEVDNNLAQLDIATQTTSIIPVGNAPTCVAITPNGETVYISNGFSNNITPFNVKTNSTGLNIPVGNFPGGMGITPDGSTLYVANISDSHVTCIDVASGIPTSSILTGQGPFGIGITPDGSTSYISNSADNTLTPIDVATSTSGAAIPLNTERGPGTIALTADGKTAYLTNAITNNVAIINLTTNGVKTIDVGINPLGIAITPDQAPRAIFSTSVGRAGKKTSFDASSSLSPVGKIVSYEWNFGDGNSTVTTSRKTTHRYSLPGIYSVTLTVTNSAGTSVNQVYTGQAMLNNGGPTATTSQLIQVP